MNQRSPMKVLPVLDLQGGQVVRGVAGRRSEYRPIVSRLCEGSGAAAVARGLRNTFGFDAAYVADLDAIAGREPSKRLYDEAAAAGLELWIDAGAATVEQCLSSVLYFAQRGLYGRTIIGLESLPDLATLQAAVRRGLDPKRTVFSLDLFEGRPLTKSPAWLGLTPPDIAKLVIDAGVRSLIVLDLAAVGVGQGVPTLEFCRSLRMRYPDIEIVSGGGVRGMADLDALENAGCDAALVASALHDGRITRAMLEDFSRRAS